VIHDYEGFGDTRKDDDTVGSDFDEFEEGAEGTGYDDFGDFDDAFQPQNGDAAEIVAMNQSHVVSLQPPIVPSFVSTFRHKRQRLILLETLPHVHF
jgi:Domain of unknown function (DUF5102)